MANSGNKFLDDFAKLMTDAAGAAQGVSGEMGTAARAQIEGVLNKLDLVRRDEFEVMKEIAVKARSEVQDLSSRVEELEKELKKNKE